MMNQAPTNQYNTNQSNTEMQLQISVDPENLIREYSEDNNIWKKGIPIPRAPDIETLAEVVNQKYIDIHGYADPYSIVKIYRDSALAGIAYSDSHGYFEYRLELVEGTNKITAVSFTSNGESGYLANIQVIKVDSTPPQAITSLNGEEDDEECFIYWPGADSSDLAGYNVYRRQNSEVRSQKINTELITNTYYYDTGVENYTTYNYVVTVLDKAGNESNYSNQVILTPQPKLLLTVDNNINAELKRVLVYLPQEFDSSNFNEQAGRLSYQQRLSYHQCLSNQLNNIQANYLITNCRNEFQEEMRTRKYNMYIINDTENKDKKCKECGKKVSESDWKNTLLEVSEAVYTGDGLILIKNEQGDPDVDSIGDLTGVKSKGYSREKDWDI
ncbi:fibronectin type III domain-containing protein [Candidatus Desantisbacteria bacterium]|nr:fibronectin type III domain-containing protein [Candidatus Desantisbacteria bacterium]